MMNNDDGDDFVFGLLQVMIVAFDAETMSATPKWKTTQLQNTRYRQSRGQTACARRCLACPELVQVWAINVSALHFLRRPGQGASRSISRCSATAGFGCSGTRTGTRIPCAAGVATGRFEWTKSILPTVKWSRARRCIWSTRTNRVVGEYGTERCATIPLGSDLGSLR